MINTELTVYDLRLIAEYMEYKGVKDVEPEDINAICDDAYDWLCQQVAHSLEEYCEEHGVQYDSEKDYLEQDSPWCQPHTRVDQSDYLPEIGETVAQAVFRYVKMAGPDLVRHIQTWGNPHS